MTAMVVSFLVFTVLIVVAFGEEKAQQCDSKDSNCQTQQGGFSMSSLFAPSDVLAKVTSVASGVATTVIGAAETQLKHSVNMAANVTSDIISSLHQTANGFSEIFTDNVKTNVGERILNASLGFLGRVLGVDTTEVITTLHHFFAAVLLLLMLYLTFSFFPAVIAHPIAVVIIGFWLFGGLSGIFSLGRLAFWVSVSFIQSPFQVVVIAIILYYVVRRVWSGLFPAETTLILDEVKLLHFRLDKMEAKLDKLLRVNDLQG